MADRLHSLSTLVSPAPLSPDASQLLCTPRGSVASLASTDTLKFTLAHSKSESVWFLQHARSSLEYKQNPESLSLRLRARLQPLQHQSSQSSLTVDYSRPRSRSVVVPALHSRVASLPSERDYRKLLKRLDKIINGSAFSFKSTTLSESRPADLGMEAGEHQFLRVKVLGQQTPLNVHLRRSKGKVVCYLSRTEQEPTEFFCDETHTSDHFQVMENNARFKTQWIYMCVNCVQETNVVVSVTFGKKPRKGKATARQQSLADLADLRKDDEKRKILNKRVDELIARRRIEFQQKYSFRDFIRENKALKPISDADQRREAEQQRRAGNLQRHFDLLHQKHAQAEVSLRRQEIRRAAEAQRAEELQAKRSLQSAQVSILRISAFLSASDSLFTAYSQRKEAITFTGKKISAAKIIQRCYKRIAIGINPVRRAKELILHHLTVATKWLWPIIGEEMVEAVLKTIRNSAKAHKVRNACEDFHEKKVKKQRMAQLEKLWTSVLSDIVSRPISGAGKKGQKKPKESTGRFLRIDRVAVLTRYYRNCQRRYYAEIAAYVDSLDAYRKSMKAFAFATKPIEEIDTGSAPGFKYLPTAEEMRAIIEEAAL